MTDFDRNVRTLIICFVLAIMGLVPLRMLEVEHGLSESTVRVLGESDSSEVMESGRVIEVDDDIVLPDVGGLE